MEGLLLAVGFVGLVFALLTAYTKAGTAAALISFAIYFYLIGIGNWLSVVVFIVGLFLIVFEIFIPGFGIAGVAGTVLLIGGLYWTVGDVAQTIRDLSIAVVITAVLVTYLIKKGHALTNMNQLVLQTNLQSDNLKKAETISVELQPGLEGTAQTPLRPSGKATFSKSGSPLYDVLSAEGMIAAGTSVVIEQIQGTKILVRVKKEQNGG